MSTDASTEKWLQIVSAIVMAAMGWLMWRTVAHDAQLQAMQYQIQSIIQTQSNVIPPVVEQSLREIREKGNAQSEILAKLTQAATSNGLEIGYLKDRVNAKQKEPP